MATDILCHGVPTTNDRSTNGDIVRKTRSGLEAARRRGKVGGRPSVDDDKRAAILSRCDRDESTREIASGVGVSVGTPRTAP